MLLTRTWSIPICALRSANVMILCKVLGVMFLIMNIKEVAEPKILSFGPQQVTMYTNPSKIATPKMKRLSPQVELITIRPKLG